MHVIHCQLIVLLGHSLFGRGICGVLNDLVCVGNHEGNILVFHVPIKGTNITLQETLKGKTILLLLQRPYKP